jgi:hypothetical protein
MTLRQAKVLEFERGSTILQCLENSLWKRLWTCCKADCRVNEWTPQMSVHWVLLLHIQEGQSSKLDQDTGFSDFDLLISSKKMAFLCFNPLNAELNPICHLLALLGAHLILHVSRIRVKVGNNCCLPHPFLVIVHLFSCHSVMNIVCHKWTK